MGVVGASTGSTSRRAFIGGGAAVSVTIAGAMAGTAVAGAAQDANPLEAAPDPIGEDQITATYDYDVVVVGACASGLPAAAAAAEEGAKVICIDKYHDSLGSGMVYGYFNCARLREAGAEDRDLAQLASDLYQASGGAADLSLLRSFVLHEPAIADWMSHVAAETGVPENVMSMEGSASVTYGERETDVYDMLKAYGGALGAEYVYETAAVQLERDGEGRVTGVIAQDNEGSYVRYNAAKGVVLATGPYNGDHELVQKYIPWVDYDSCIEYSPIASTGNTGDGLKMAMWAGALIGKAPHCAMIHFNSGAQPVAGTLFVNARGERFTDEGSSMEVFAQAAMRQPGGITYCIKDSKSIGVNEGLPMAVNQQEIVECDTVEELAEAFGMDAGVLSATIERWNELITAGEDADFFSDLATAQAIDTPPYVAQASPCCALAMMGGPQINAEMQVLDTNYEPIEGLYAAGDCTCGMFGVNYPMQTLSGVARVFCTVSGYLAAKNALGVETSEAL